MKKLVALEPRIAGFKDYEDREIEKNEVRIRVIFATPKPGTEIVDFRGLSPFIDEEFSEEWRLFLPREEGSQRGVVFGEFQLGNMIVGTIEETGSLVTEYQKGELVCTYGPIRETLITNGVDNYKLRKLDRLDQWKNAVCYDPAQFALGGIREAHVRAGDAVAIFGLGAIGQIAIQLAKKAGATTIVGIDPIAQRRELAEKYGADYTLDPMKADVGFRLKELTDKRGVDSVIETSGSAAALQASLRGIGYGGIISYVAFARPAPRRKYQNGRSSPRRRTMKFGTQDQAFFPRDILEKFRFIKDCGFEEYEIDGKLLIENIDTVKQAIKETGIPVVTACNGYDGWIGDFIEERRLNGVRQIAEILRALSEVGGKGIVIPAAWGMFTYRLPPMVSPRSKEGDYKAVSESLRYLDKVAEETGTVIYLEPLNRYQDHMINLLADARHYIDSNQLKHVQIIADFYHMNIEEDDISKALTTQKEYVGHIHLADNHRYQPGSGAIDFTRHFQMLLQNEYEGYMVYECRLRGENEVKIYQESLQYLKNCLETARHLNDLEKEKQ